MTERIRSGSPYEETIGFSRAVVHGDRVLVSGTAPVPPQGEPVAESAREQMRRCGEIIAAALEQAGTDLSRVIRTRMFITDPADADEIGAVHRELFGEARPAATMVIVAALLDPAWKVEVEVEGIVEIVAGR
ncbi:MAG: RidA family protein [Acidimicrobiia bacterium]|nr:RidA family protein [Acidimicrobiia bacterium]NNF09379.1 RidA family protein [Acidimicrobiia bacterium]NNL71182.1 RidA family protein [Acidimicrobiia bacterium]